MSNFEMLLLKFLTLEILTLSSKIKGTKNHFLSLFFKKQFIPLKQLCRTNIIWLWCQPLNITDLDEGGVL